VKVTIAVDAMGGDHGPQVTVPASLQLLERDPEVEIILVGLPEPIEEVLRKHSAAASPRLKIHPATQVVEMDEAPAFSLKKKKDSSLRVALDLVKEGTAHCCVSAGNTGALMATARFVLKMLPGIERPAIASKLPTRHGHVLVLDLGANVDCEPLHLQQFAIMGSILSSAVDGVPQPTVGLLNIGHEAIKGNEIIKQAAELLAQAPINFYGNVEGDDVFKGTVDVVVCDGFVGNVLLKSAEGLASTLASMLKRELTRNWFTRLCALPSLPALRRFRKSVDHRKYNGASLLGLKGLVVKSHGGADAYAFRHALQHAVSEARNNVSGRIEKAITEMEIQAA
jgi:glycerol-3-phosphate acyltransferase PlsX